MITLSQYLPNSPHGELSPVNLQQAANSLDELTNQLPEGVYTTFRTFNKFYALNINSHIQRLIHSAELKSRQIQLNGAILRKYLRSVLEAHPAKENRVRIIITWENKVESEIVYIAVEDLHTPAKELYRTGVTVKTVQLARDNPEAKATDFITQTRELRTAITDGINELLMVTRDGVILEGLSSNFFAVLRNEIFTASIGILPGITRNLVLDSIRNAQLPVHLNGINKTNIPDLQEAFITSSSRGVLPVTKINENPIGCGHPGPVTRKLMKAYQKSVEELIAPI